MSLTDKKCAPCEGGVAPITGSSIREYLSQLENDWEVLDDKKIHRLFQFKDFKKAIDFVNKVADLAEEENHHPNIHIFYDKVRVDLTTHVIHGLSENDFILAAKIDKLAKP